MIRITNIRVKPPFQMETLRLETAKKLRVNAHALKELRIVKSSIDARKKSNIFYLCSVDASLPYEEKYLSLPDVTCSPSAIGGSAAAFIKRRTDSPPLKSRPVIIGSGPAGMMAGLVLARAGQRPIILERGKSADQRKQDVDLFRRNGALNPESNVQFGEGGAGTFSDGKLTTGTNDPRLRYVLETFIEHGAPDEIGYSSKPHVGTDLLIHMVQSIRAEITELGGEYRFGHKLTGLNIKDNKLTGIMIDVNDGMIRNQVASSYELPAEHLILAIGHSARDTFDMLYQAGLHMQQKAFSAGVRIEHPQAMINRAQYGDFADVLPPADYKLAIHLPNGRGVYTFCMCPGGEVIAAASEAGHLVTNGMSYYKRDLVNANSALLVSVTPNDFTSDHPLAGVTFQRSLERSAFLAGGGNYSAPVQRVGDFLRNQPTSAFGDVIPSYIPGVKGCNLSDFLPGFISDSMREALPILDRKLKGFAAPDAIMTGVETRSSSPVRILRNEALRANIDGIIPCGEGCGYAGGIISAAVDGIRCAESIL